MSSLTRGHVEVPVIETERLRLRGPRPEGFASSAAMLRRQQEPHIGLQQRDKRSLAR
jgi:hypothetical protein